jgi:hypothetical protein
MKTGEQLEVTMQEYESVLGEKASCETGDVPWELVETRLINEHGWTREGAEQIARLAREYGAFMLRNALALAGALKIEDGELQY